MCQAYRRQYGFNAISLMPTNLYGPGDNFDLTNSHVLPALIRRFHEARLRGDDEVVVWGSGSPKREFLHCDDLANAVVLLMKTYESEELVNIGCGQDITIRELAELVSKVVGFAGRLTRPSRTGRRASCSTSVASLASVGRRRSRWRKVSRIPTGGSLTTRKGCGADTHHDEVTDLVSGMNGRYLWPCPAFPLAMRTAYQQNREVCNHQ